MSEQNTATVASTQAVREQVLGHMAHIHQYDDASPAVREALVSHVVTLVTEEKIPLDEVLEGLADFGTADEFLAEDGVVVAPQEQAIDTAIATEQAKEQRLQEQIVAAADRAAEQEAEAREQANDTLKQCVKAYRKGEKAYSAGLLESGRLADVFVHQRLVLGDDRKAAVQQIEGALAQFSSTAVNANDLIGCYHAYRLLAEEPGVKAEHTPYGQYRDAWSQLVQRLEKDTPKEHWVLLPGVETECLAAFAKATDARISLAKCQEAVKGIQRQYMGARAKAAEQVKADAHAKAKAQADDAEAKRIATLRAVQEAQQADARAAAAQGDDKALLTAVAEEARQKLEREQREFTEALARADADKRVAAKADADAKAKREAEAKATERERKAQEKAALKAAGVTPEKGESKGVSSPLQAVGKAGTAKDVAAMCLELITGADKPGDVLAELLELCSQEKKLPTKARVACDAAIEALESDTAKPSATAAA